MTKQEFQEVWNFASQIYRFSSEAPTARISNIVPGSWVDLAKDVLLFSDWGNRDTYDMKLAHISAKKLLTKSKKNPDLTKFLLEIVRV